MSNPGKNSMTPEGTEAGFREIFEEDPRPMWVVDRESRKFLAANRAALCRYGYPLEEFLSLTRERVAPEGGEGHLRKDGKSFPVEVEERPITFAGRSASLEILNDPAKGSDREVELARQLKEKSAELEGAQKELEGFSYSISHDLRAPLRHIDGFSKALLDDYGEKLGEQAREYLARISLAAKKMSLLIDDLQKLGRVTRQELILQPVNLSMVAQVISLEQKLAAPARSRVEFTIAQGVSGTGDAKLLRTLLECLLDNAWKFTSKNEAARIEFGWEEREGETVYFVKDDGVGFDMAYADKLFAVFHRLHRLDEFEGAGIGLAIAHRVVKRHGGRIWAKSAPGAGATFYFTLQGDR